MQRSRPAPAGRRYDDDASGKAKAQKRGNWGKLLLSLLVLGVLSIVVPVLLGADVPSTPADYLRNVKRTFRSFVLRRPDTPPADTSAAILLFKTYASSAQNLQPAEVSDALLSAVLAGHDEPLLAASAQEEGGAASTPAPSDAALAMVDALGPVVEASLDSPVSSTLPNDLAGLFLLSLCSQWTATPASDKGDRVAQGRRIADTILARTTPEGLYDVRSSDAIRGGAASTPIVAARTLRQVQAMAGLRCLGQLVDASTRVVSAKHVGPHAGKRGGGGTTGRTSRLEGIRKHNAEEEERVRAADVPPLLPPSSLPRRSKLQEMRKADAAAEAARPKRRETREGEGDGEEASPPRKPRRSVLEDIRRRGGGGEGDRARPPRGRALLESVQEPPNPMIGGGMYYAAAERLRRGLHYLLASPEDTEDGAGPFHVGLTHVDGTGAGRVESPGVLHAVHLTPLRYLSSELPQLLLFLEPGDVPTTVVEEVARNAAHLSSPVGIRTGQLDVDADTWATPTAPWRVSPGEHAVILWGTLKHLLCLEVGGEAVEGAGLGEGRAAPGAWSTADALATLVDRVLRVATPLAAVQKEAAGRDDAVLAETSARLAKVLAEGSRGVGAKVLAEGSRGVGESGGASERKGGSRAASARSSLLSSAHRYPFPSSFVPVHIGAGGVEETPLDPTTSPPMLPVWSWLRGTSGLSGTLFRLRYLGTMAGGGAKLRVNKPTSGGGGKAAPPMDTSAAREMAAQLLASLAYPAGGLRVVRLPSPPEGGEGMTQGQRRAQEEENAATRAGLASLGLGADRSVGLEHVVIPVRAHGHDASPDAPALEGEEDEKGAGEVLVRGDGHPVSLTTIIAARTFRTLYEAAYSWHKSRQSKAGGAPTPTPVSINPHPLPSGAGAGARLLDKGKAALRAVSSKLASVKLQSVLFPFKKRSASSGTAPTISNGALLAFLTSGAQEAGGYADQARWGDAEKEAQWRATGQREEGEGGGEGGVVGGGREEGGNAAAPPPPLPRPEAQQEEGEGGATRAGGVAAPNSIPRPDDGSSTRGEEDTTGLGDVLGDSPADGFTGEGGDGAAGQGGASGAGTGEEGAGEGVEAPLLDPTALHARLCTPSTPYSAGREPPWLAACCTPVLERLARAGTHVAVDALPTFACRGEAESSESVRVSCAYAEDDVCDCGGDAVDENSTSACGRAGGAFWCASGARVVRGGELVASGVAPLPLPLGTPASSLRRGDLARYGYVPADKVGDGVVDCVEGEDEA